MNLVIGFTNKYYTLWSYTTEDTFYTDGNGNSYKTGGFTHYMYHKNISFELDKVRELYPGVSIDEGLCGKSRDFSVETKTEYGERILPRGKYRGSLIDEIETIEPEYLIWFCESMPYETVSKHILELPYVKSHYDKIKLAEESKLSEKQRIIENMNPSGEYTVNFEKNPSVYPLYDFKCLSILNENCPDWMELGDIEVATSNVEINGVPTTIIFPNFKTVYAQFTYTMVNIDGKNKRLKNKTFNLKLQNIGYFDYDSPVQIMLVTN